MNNPIIEFLLSPILSLFSTRFYREVLKSSLGRGLLYLLYTSLIGAAVFMLVFKLRVAPVIDEFVNWFSHEMPQVTLENGKISSPVAQPFRMKHPKFGTILILDTTKESLKPEEMKEAVVYVAKSFVYTRNPVNNETRMIDLASIDKQRGANQKAGAYVVNGKIIGSLFEKVKGYFVSVLFFGVAAIIFVWKISAALFYSLIALILNMFREEKFSYASLLNVSAFALTAVSIIQLLGMITSNPAFRLYGWMAAVITTIYLGLALFIASPPEREPEKENAS